MKSTENNNYTRKKNVMVMDMLVGLTLLKKKKRKVPTRRNHAPTNAPLII